MENVKFKFKVLNENDEMVLGFTKTEAIDIVNQSIEKVVSDFEKVLYETVNKLGYDIELHDVRDNVIYRGYKYLKDDTHYMTIEIVCDGVDFSHHGFSE